MKDNNMEVTGNNETTNPTGSNPCRTANNNVVQDFRFNLVSFLFLRTLANKSISDDLVKALELFSRLTDFDKLSYLR